LPDLAEHLAAEDLGERLAADVAVDAERGGVGAGADDVAVGEDTDLLEDRTADERRRAVAGLARQRIRKPAGRADAMPVVGDRAPGVEDPARDPAG
jgi:hypothetical protein